MERAYPLQFIDPDRSAHSLQLEGAEVRAGGRIPKPVSSCSRSGRPGRRGELLHLLAEADGIAVGRVDHLQIIADRPTTTSPELRPIRTAKLSSLARLSSSA